MVSSPSKQRPASPTSLNQTASGDGKSVLSAWESVVGQDDPTVPISNVRTQREDIPDCETIQSFVTQPLIIEDENETNEERDNEENSSEGEAVKEKAVRDQLNELDQAEKEWQYKMSNRVTSNLSIQITSTESAADMQTAYEDETGRLLKLEARQRQSQASNSRETTQIEENDDLPDTQSLDTTVSGDGSESTSADSMTVLTHHPVPFMKSISSETATDEIVRQVQQRLHLSEGNIVPQTKSTGGMWNPSFDSPNSFDDVEEGNFDQKETPKSANRRKNFWKLNLDDVDDKSDGNTQNSSDEEHPPKDDSSTKSRKSKFRKILLYSLLMIVATLLVLYFCTDGFGKEKETTTTDGLMSNSVSDNDASLQVNPTSSPVVSLLTSSPTLSPTNSPVSASTNSPILAPTNAPFSATTNSPTSTPTNSPVSASTNSPTSPVFTSTNSPTSTPTSQLTKDKSAFLHLYTISGDLLFDENSSQYRAYGWLSQDDPANLDIDNLPLKVLEQRYVAALVYFALDGDNWDRDCNFLTEANVCNWKDGTTGQGIDCDSSEIINDITINENNFSGSLPFELKVLDGLKKLQLRQNNINGPIPSELGELPLLEEIDLRQNELAGEIPDSIFELPNLKRLILLRNGELTGSIPSSIGSASSLEMISFHQCQLTGTLPESMGDLSNLYFLTLMGNYFSGSVPAAFTKLSKLEVLELSDNSFTGHIPNFNGDSQPGLYFVSLFNNKFSGNIPETFGSLTDMLFLDLHDNEIEGTIPSIIGNLPNLTTFYVSSNKLVGSLPSFAGNEGMLKVIDISENKVTGRVQDFFTEDGPSERLVKVNFESNQLSGIIPPSIGLYDSMKEFAIASNFISGSMPSEIGELSKLEHFSVGNNNMKGYIPYKIGNLNKLISLNLEENNFFGVVPSSLNSLPKLDELRLNGNNFRGTLDDTFCQVNDSRDFSIFVADCLTGVSCSCCTSCL